MVCGAKSFYWGASVIPTPDLTAGTAYMVTLNGMIYGTEFAWETVYFGGGLDHSAILSGASAGRDSFNTYTGVALVYNEGDVIQIDTGTYTMPCKGIVIFANGIQKANSFFEYKDLEIGNATVATSHYNVPGKGNFFWGGQAIATPDLEIGESYIIEITAKVNDMQQGWEFVKFGGGEDIVLGITEGRSEFKTYYKRAVVFDKGEVITIDLAKELYYTMPFKGVVIVIGCLENSNSFFEYKDVEVGARTISLTYLPTKSFSVGEATISTPEIAAGTAVKVVISARFVNVSAAWETVGSYNAQGEVINVFAGNEAGVGEFKEYTFTAAVYDEDHSFDYDGTTRTFKSKGIIIFLNGIGGGAQSTASFEFEVISITPL